MTHGSLFSGIGGFDLAAEWMGWQNVFHCERNPFGQKVLKYYWPEAISYNDITKTDFTIHRGRIDILTGGFPCQPYSMAGKRLGKEDDRHLWPEMLRAIREIQPRWVVGENVLGLVNWSDGLVFHEVQADLEAEGYEVQPFVLPAVAVNAPHRRDRVWFVAHARNISRGCKCGCENKRERELLQDEQQGSKVRPSSPGCCSNRTAKDTIGDGQHGSDCQHEINAGQGRFDAQRDIEQGVGDGDAPDTDSTRIQGLTIDTRTSEEIRQGGESVTKAWNVGYVGGWEKFPTQSPICDGNDGISSRLDGITFSKWRQESIKAGGNAVVPQVVLQIFKAIAEYEKLIIQRPSV